MKISKCLYIYSTISYGTSTDVPRKPASEALCTKKVQVKCVG